MKRNSRNNRLGSDVMTSQEEELEFDMDEEYSMDEESVEEYTDENLDEM